LIAALMRQSLNCSKGNYVIIILTWEEIDANCIMHAFYQIRLCSAHHIHQYRALLYLWMLL
jgi:hypothetical protein